MTEVELANHQWWASLWGWIENAAYLGVVLTLAMEFTAHRFAAPHLKALADAKDERIASLEKEASEANSKTAEVMKAAAWRQLTPFQRQEISGVISGSPHGKVLLSWIANDPESLFLATQLSSIFSDAGWTVEPSSRTYATRLLWGIWVPDGPGSVTLREAFARAHIPVTPDKLPVPDMAMGASSAGPDTATLLVGSRRPVLAQSP